MKLQNPLSVHFKSGNGNVEVLNNRINIPAFANWSDFNTKLSNIMKSKPYDYIALSYSDMTDLDNPTVLKSTEIKTNGVIKQANNQGLRVFNRFENQLYFVNPTFDESSAAKRFAPSDETVLQKRDSFQDDYAWQKHQSDILKKFAVLMPLTSGQPFEKTNHTEMLTAPSRGLTKPELKDFFSWKSNKVIIPELMGDNMVGMPSVKATSFKDIQLAYGDTDIPTTPLSLKTIGLSGAMIPMKNPRGDSPKYQIATDISPINVVLKAKAADGVSIQKSEYFNKKTGIYNFKLNGEPSQLHVTEANNKEIVFTDTKGTFKGHLKEDLKQFMTDRGYDIPPLIDNIKPNANSKYIWMSQGDMIGSRAINNTKQPENNRISPSMAGFITAKEPTKGSDEYLVLVAEGALKGVITANYLTRKDANGHSVGNFIAKDRGIIVAQVPGVAASFVKSVDRIYSEKKVIGTYIAMDADGRDNLSVAQGIHSAFKELSKNGPVKVMSWNPDQKGIDDSLIAVANHKITVEDMDIHFGKPEKLFPLEEASRPNPYHLDGTRANQQEWKIEYTKSRKENDKRVRETQKESDTGVQLSLDDLSSNELQQ